ncbi:MAG: response regulator [Thermodesulfovibrionales bacterium]
MGSEERKKIVVIDDEPLILLTIERALAKVGYSVCAARNRNELFAALRQGPFDLCILDLHMGDIDSLEIRERVRESSPGARFLIISGSQCTEPGHFLQKPFKIETLRELVRQILESSG